MPLVTSTGLAAGPAFSAGARTSAAPCSAEIIAALGGSDPAGMPSCCAAGWRRQPVE